MCHHLAVALSLFGVFNMVSNYQPAAGAAESEMCMPPCIFSRPAPRHVFCRARLTSAEVDGREMKKPEGVSGFFVPRRK